MKPLRCVAAMDTKRGIGKDNNLPWRLRNEMHYFGKITSEVSDPGLQNVVMMGRKTWESIPPKFKPLPNRINIVLSRTLTDVPQDVIIKQNLSAAMDSIDKEPLADKVDKVFVVGGAGVYKEAIQSGHCDRIYLTHVMGDFSCDTFFPEFDETLYKRISDPQVPEGIQEEKGIQYEFRLYERQMQS